VRENHRDFFDFVVNHAKTSYSEKEKEKPTTMFLEGLQELKERGVFNTSIRSVSGKLAIYFQSAYGAYQQMMRQRGIEVNWKKNTILDEFSELDCLSMINNKIKKIPVIFSHNLVIRTHY